MARDNLIENLDKPVFDKSTDTSDNITEGAVNKFLTVTERAKLANASTDIDAELALKVDKLPPTSITSNDTAVPSDRYLIVTATTDITLNLPDVTLVDHPILIVNKTSNRIFVESAFSDLIQGESNMLINRKLSSAFLTNSYHYLYGGSATSELIGKNPYNNSVAPIYTSKTITEYSLSPDGNSLINNPNYPISHVEPNDLGASGSPACKRIAYFAEEDGMIYLVKCFKEIIYDDSINNEDGSPSNTFGDDGEFISANKIVFVPDDNGNTMAHGTVISKKAIGFAKKVV